MAVSMQQRWMWLLATCLLLVAGGCQNLSGGFAGLFAPKRPSGDPFAQSHDWRAEPTAQQKLDVQLALAASLESQGKTEDAIRAYREIVTQHKSAATAYHRLAVLHERKGDPAARDYYKQALQADPKNPEILCDYGYSCYLRREWATAENHLRKAIALRPSLARAHNNLGLLLARTGREADAVAQFREAGCSEAAARANLALAYALEQRYAEAEREYHAALSAEPGLLPAQEGLTALRALQAKTLSVDAPPTFGMPVQRASYQAPAAQ